MLRACHCVHHASSYWLILLPWSSYFPLALCSCCGSGVFQDRIKSFSLLFMDLTLKPDFGYKASLCDSLAVISLQARIQHMNITFKGSMLEVARKTKRWKLDIAGRNSPGGNWFKYLTKAWKCCTQGKRKKTQNYRNCTKVQSWVQFLPHIANSGWKIPLLWNVTPVQVYGYSK